MLGAPLDIAKTLPDNWRDQVLGYHPVGVDAPFLELIQDFVRDQGERAITIRHVQYLALWITRDRTRPSGLATPLMERVAGAANGPWVIEWAVQERKPAFSTKHPLNASEDLDAIEAEWLVLDWLWRRGARPVRPTTNVRVFDWRIERGGEGMDLEVKSKASVGVLGHRLEWFWKGFSLLPRGRFVRNYSWHWHVHDAVRSSSARDMMDAMWDVADSLEAILPDALERARSIKPFDEDLFLANERLVLRSSFLTQQPSVALELRGQDKIRVDITRNHQPTVLDCTGLDGGWMKPTLGDADRANLIGVLDRLNIEAQVRRRGSDGLYVIVWWVPFLWEEALGLPWLEGICNALAVKYGLRHVAIWPIAMFEARRVLWALSDMARQEISWIVRQASPDELVEVPPASP